MIIKNTKELYLRADSHTKNDHVKQGTYAEARVNGKAEFKGCAVGCLSTPHRQKDLLKFLKDHNKDEEFHGELWLGISDIEQRDLLAEEFGINIDLAVLAEAYFESQPTHAEAIDFIRNFAHSLKEGVDISEEWVHEFVDNTFDLDSSWWLDYKECGTHANFEDIQDQLFTIATPDNDGTYNDDGYGKYGKDDEKIRELTKKFLAALADLSLADLSKVPA